MATQPASTVPQLGEMLRYWRHERGKSQLDLSLDTGISQRHLSFVESGRSVPSRDLLSIVADALNIPLRERNVLLLASGYAPLYSEQTMDAAQMAIVTQAIDRMLQQHEPHPALVLDRYWNVIRTNQAAPRFFGSFVDLEARPKPRNLLDLMFDPPFCSYLLSGNIGEKVEDHRQNKIGGEQLHPFEPICFSVRGDLTCD